MIRHRADDAGRLALGVVLRLGRWVRVARVLENR